MPGAYNKKDELHAKQYSLFCVPPVAVGCEKERHWPLFYFHSLQLKASVGAQ
jgi:hypothetical protein